MRITRVLQITTLLATTSSPVFAQDDLDVKLNDMYRMTYVEAMPRLLEATAKLKEATGHKDEAAKVRAAAADLAKGGDKPNPDLTKTVMTLQSEASKSLADDLTAGTAKVSADQMQAFIDGVVSYFEGTVKTGEAAQLIPDLSKALSAFQMPKNPMAARKAMSTVGAAKALVDNVPVLLSSNLQTTKALKAYVTANRIKVPTEVLNMNFPGK
ncbi:hypothetical protein [Gemmatimonas sp.]|jgi:hypothetical protein|uniref:hypothetical protein n=1 Tax=Gemmatimonas sp. TaxID=1962908 RepID=UPI0022CC06A0|nr:hypothetical protein [Gemmatimonas sp.]MCZ8203788.1 hypothetical protein [Gemmatimonas sp.]